MIWTASEELFRSPVKTGIGFQDPPGCGGDPTGARLRDRRAPPVLDLAAAVLGAGQPERIQAEERHALGLLE